MFLITENNGRKLCISKRLKSEKEETTASTGKRGITFNTRFETAAKINRKKLYISVSYEDNYSYLPSRHSQMVKIDFSTPFRRPIKNLKS